MTSRRGFLLAALAAPALVRCAGARPVRFSDYPFTLGVASGYPLPDGVALWTRLAPKPLEGGGIPPEDVPVRWEVAHDERFARLAASGLAIAAPRDAHAVHVEPAGLEPAREYFYRFLAGGEASPVGRTRTAPAPGAAAPLRFAVGSCQQYEQGWYVAHRHLAQEGADLVIFVGDYIYESSWGRDHVRRHPAPEPRTLAEYRDRYALYKSDRDLQAAHAAAPWVVTWDDHEVDNDYADDRSEDLDPAFLARRAAAYRAFAEHMPLRRGMRRPDGGVRLYTHLDWGATARLHVLDTRQHRSHQACPVPTRGGSNIVPAACTERLEPGRTLLGAEQERWLEASLAASRARWNLLAQTTLFAPGGRMTARDGLVHWTDGWDGYPAARERLLAALGRTRAANPVLLGGDVHACLAADVHARPDDPGSPVVASELVATSISSQGMSPRNLELIRAHNAHVRYGERDTRGYLVGELDARGLAARQRGVETVKRPEAQVRTVAAFHVEAGRPGVK